MKITLFTTTLILLSVVVCVISLTTPIHAAPTTLSFSWLTDNNSSELHSEESRCQEMADSFRTGANFTHLLHLDKFTLTFPTNGDIPVHGTYYGLYGLKDFANKLNSTMEFSNSTIDVMNVDSARGLCVISIKTHIKSLLTGRSTDHAHDYDLNEDINNNELIDPNYDNDQNENTKNADNCDNRVKLVLVLKSIGTKYIGGRFAFNTPYEYNHLVHHTLNFYTQERIKSLTRAIFHFGYRNKCLYRHFFAKHANITMSTYFSQHPKTFHGMFALREMIKWMSAHVLRCPLDKHPPHFDEENQSNFEDDNLDFECSDFENQFSLLTFRHDEDNDHEDNTYNHVTRHHNNNDDNYSTTSIHHDNAALFELIAELNKNDHNAGDDYNHGVENDQIAITNFFSSIFGGDHHNCDCNNEDKNNRDTITPNRPHPHFRRADRGPHDHHDHHDHHPHHGGHHKKPHRPCWCRFNIFPIIQPYRTYCDVEYANDNSTAAYTCFPPLLKEYHRNFLPKCIIRKLYQHAPLIRVVYTFNDGRNMTANVDSNNDLITLTNHTNLKITHIAYTALSSHFGYTHGNGWNPRRNPHHHHHHHYRPRPLVHPQPPQICPQPPRLMNDENNINDSVHHNENDENVDTNRYQPPHIPLDHDIADVDSYNDELINGSINNGE